MNKQTFSKNLTAPIVILGLCIALFFIATPPVNAQGNTEGFCGAGCSPDHPDHPNNTGAGSGDGPSNTTGQTLPGGVQVVSGASQLGNSVSTQRWNGQDYDIYIGDDGNRYAVSANNNRDHNSDTSIVSTPTQTTPTQDPADYQPGWPDLKPIDISFTPVGQNKVANQMKLEVGRYTPKVKIKNIGCLATNYEAPEGAEQYKDWFDRAVKAQQSYNTDTNLGETLTRETPSLFERFIYSFTNVAHAGKKGRNYLKNMDKLPCGNIYDVFKNAGAKGKNGSFPVVLRIDLNGDGKFNYKTINGVKDYIEVKTVGPLAIKESKTISFPRVKMIEGKYLTDVIIDPLNGDYSCGGNFGCIDEPRGAEHREVNGLEETVFVAQPNLVLGTFLRNYPEKRNWKDLRIIDRTDDDTTRDQIGLMWRGNAGVDLSRCEGWLKTTDGRDQSTFDGTPNSRNTYTTSILGRNTYDRSIREPQTGETYKYVIRCRSSVFRNWIVDDVEIYAKEADEVFTEHDLYPTLSDIYADPGEEVTSIKFVAYNSTTTDFANVEYELRIEGTPYGSGIIPSLPAESDLEVSVTGSWDAPDTISTTSMRVILTHPTLDGPSRARANIIVNSDVPPDTCHDGEDNDNDDLTDVDDPDCPDDGGGGDETTCDNPDGCPGGGGPTCEDREDNDLDGLTDGDDPDCPDTCPDDDPDCTGGENNPNLPTISAYPELVRQGDTTKLTWELNGHPSCTFSSNVINNDVPDGSVSNPVTIDGDVDVEVQHMSIFSIDCGLVGASTTVRVLPSIEEN